MMNHPQGTNPHNPELIREWGVLRRGEDGKGAGSAHISWATLYQSEQAARDNATPLDSVEYRWVSAWSGVVGNQPW